jgi:pilus assembly protein Flp/PilA
MVSAYYAVRLPMHAFALRNLSGCNLQVETVMNFVSRFLSNESGATAIEYGLIAAGIAVAIITILKSVGTDLVAKFTTVDNGLK